MQYLKISMFLAVFALMLSTFNVWAYVSPGSTTYSSVTLKADKTAYVGDWRTKNTTNYQYYSHVGSTTSWSGDCDDCIVSTDLYDTIGKINSTTTVKGDYKKIANSALRGDYFIKLWRVNPGLIKTLHTGTWYMNVPRA